MSDRQMIEKMLTAYTGNRTLSKVEKMKRDPMNDWLFLVRTGMGDFLVDVSAGVYDGIEEVEGDKYFGPFGGE
jgi:hypothetical protein